MSFGETNGLETKDDGFAPLLEDVDAVIRSPQLPRLSSSPAKITANSKYTCL